MTRAAAAALVAALAAAPWPALLLPARSAGAEPDPAPKRADATVSDGRYVMGTVLEITLHGAGEPALRAQLEPLFDVARDLEAKLSRWIPASDISKLNEAAGRGSVPVAAETADLLRRASRLGVETGGTFDVTVGPLVALWTDAAQRNVLPTAAALAAARERVGADRIGVDGDRRAELPTAGMAVDLGGIAKGYALDRMLPQLEAGGVRGALLSFGQSSTWAVGTPADAPGWRLAARGPDGGILGILTLRDQALSVSGSLGESSVIAGRHYGHVVDPRTGQPLTRRAQAIVVAPTATEAEAFSKALLILGEEEGIALLTRRRGSEGLLVDAEGGAWRTPGFDAAVHFERFSDTQDREASLRSVGR